MFLITTFLAWDGEAIPIWLCPDKVFPVTVYPAPSRVILGPRDIPYPDPVIWISVERVHVPPGSPPPALGTHVPTESQSIPVFPLSTPMVMESTMTIPAEDVSEIPSKSFRVFPVAVLPVKI